MRKNLTFVTLAVIALAGVACSKDDGPTFSFSPLPPSSSPSAVTGSNGTTINPSGSLPPSSSPGITGTVTDGAATLNVTGSTSTSVSLAELVSPALWAPPPGSMALQWDGPNGQSFGMGGSSFAGQQPTSPALSLSFVIRIDDVKVEFRSIGGECLITITPAEVSSMGGQFQCTGVKNGDGTIVVNAQGSFTAVG
jgi:hypothetical protein